MITTRAFERPCPHGSIARPADGSRRLRGVLLALEQQGAAALAKASRLWLRSAKRAQMRDEPSSRRIEVGRGLSLVANDRRQARGELLAEFDTPLVERVDVPDRALREHLVLVERDEPAERTGIEALIEERARRAAAGEALVGREPF